MAIREMRPVCRLLVGVGLAAVVVGCSNPPPSSVSGIITYRGKPLAGAVVTFYAAGHTVLTTETQASGTYAIGRVPRGTVRVAVQVPQPAVRPGAGPDPPPAAGATAPPAFPAKYGDPNTSGLKFELTEQSRNYSPDLE
jgi:hypothetical protein